MPEAHLKPASVELEASGMAKAMNSAPDPPEAKMALITWPSGSNLAIVSNPVSNLSAQRSLLGS